MDEHPPIRFADGPAGRRARLTGTGLDVWEVIAAVHDNNGEAAEAARYLEIPLGLVQAAITYYGACREEIDDWIALNAREAQDAHVAWRAGQARRRGCSRPSQLERPIRSRDYAGRANRAPGHRHP